MKALPDITVQGIGWLDRETYGGIRRREQHHYAGTSSAPSPWQRPELWGYTVKSMGRFDDLTRLTCAACALTLWDAGEVTAPGETRNIGLLGTNAAGSVLPNRAYFQDYVQAGRTLGRGNLFIYTLPTSPLAETAIHFGLHGPLLYVGFPDDGLAALLKTGALMIAAGEAERLLVLRADEREAVGFLLGQAPTRTGTLDNLLKSVAGQQPAGTLAARLAEMAGEMINA